MQTAISTSSYIGRETAYDLHPFAWGPARSATVAAFAGQSFRQHWAELAAAIHQLGVKNVEVWSAHISNAATPEMVDQTRALLDEHDLTVVAYAASLRRPGLTEAELERTFTIARQLGAPLIAGGLHPAYAPIVYSLCERYSLRFAIENHPEHDPLEIVAQLDGREKWFGTTLDTGWYRTHGVDVPSVVHALRAYILHVHLKDVREVGLPHRTCALGDGVVGIHEVLSTLDAIGYDGVLSIEHEPPHHDPTPELRASLDRITHWLQTRTSTAVHR